MDGRESEEGVRRAGLVGLVDSHSCVAQEGTCRETSQGEITERTRGRIVVVSSKEDVGDKDRGRGWKSVGENAKEDETGMGAANSESLIQVERSSMGGLYVSKKTLLGGPNS